MTVREKLLEHVTNINDYETGLSGFFLKANGEKMMPVTAILWRNDVEVVSVEGTLDLSLFKVKTADINRESK